MSEHVLYGLECICHPERGFRYIGITSVGASRRLSQHLSDATKYPHLPVSRWKIKHGFDNILLTPIAEYETRDELIAAEIEAIEAFRREGAADLNLTAGGDGWEPGRPHTEETKAKISRAAIASYRSGTRKPRTSVWTPYSEEERAARALHTKMLWQEGRIDNRGARNGSAKLTEDAVRYIRANYPTASAIELGEKYGVHPSTICDIASGRSWKDVR